MPICNAYILYIRTYMCVCTYISFNVCLTDIIIDDALSLVCSMYVCTITYIDRILFLFGSKHGDPETWCRCDGNGFYAMELVWGSEGEN